MPRQAEEVLQYEDFLGWTVSSHKDFLSLRGLKQTGRKPELVARAFGAYELKAPVKFSQQQIYQQIKEEYSRRLNSNGINTDPNTIPHEAWIDVASQHDGSLQGFKQCGLFIKPDYPYLAASPDGLFLCKCCGLSIVEAKCPYSVRNENIHVKETFDRVDFLEDFHGKPRLKRSHKYYTQMQAQMWVCGVCHGFFIVWTQVGPPLYERIELDMEFCLTVVNNITLFYRSFVLPCLLGYRDIFDCPKCNKVILEEDEISNSEKENSICCDTCSTWWHLPCADLTISTADALDSWVCQSCLTDAARAMDNEDVLEFNFAQESEETVTSTALNHVCPVCSMKSIPVNGEHVCTVCKKAVRA